jgi:CheY-like chemotaxis protein
MKAAQTELTIRKHRSAELDLPRVLVAAPTDTASVSIAHALRDAAYAVSTTVTGEDTFRGLRNQQAIELLVLDGSERPRSVGATIEAVRAMNWALPIILIAPADPELHAEAKRLGVEAILEAPVAPDEIRRAAARLVPVVPEVELDLAG